MKTAIELIEELDFKDLNVLEIKSALKSELTIMEINRALRAINEKKQVGLRNTFGKCGIDPEVNPCGDADEY